MASNDAKSGRYASVTPESIRMQAESAGFADLSDDILSILSEDISYRLREIINNASHFMSHSKRTKLTCDDIDRALEFADVQPVPGHGLTELPSWAQCGDVYILNDPPVNLVETALDNTPAPRRSVPSTIKSFWLPSEESENHIIKETFKSENCEMLSSYFESAMTIIMGNDATMKQIVIEDIKTNFALNSALEWFIEFINREHTESPEKAENCIHIISALVSNQCLCWENNMFLTCLTKALMNITMKNDLSILNSPIVDFAGNLMVDILHVVSDPIHNLFGFLCESLRESIVNSEQSSREHVGAISLVNHTGIEIILHFLPKLKLLAEGLQSLDQEKELVTYKTYLLKEIFCKVIQTVTNTPTPETSDPDSMALIPKTPLWKSTTELYAWFHEMFGDSVILPRSSIDFFLKYSKDTEFHFQDGSANVPGEVLLQELLDKVDATCTQDTFKVPAKPVTTRKPSVSKSRKIGGRRRSSSARSKGGAKKRKLSCTNREVFDTVKLKRFSKHSISFGRINDVEHVFTPKYSYQETMDTTNDVSQVWRISAQMKPFGKRLSLKKTAYSQSITCVQKYCELLTQPL